MPTREEKVAQLEAALRKRFFPNVPRIEGANRAGWLDEQHDLDRLSRALAAYALVGEAGLDDTTAAGSITDGENDCGIDALHFDRTNNRLLIVQAKYKRDGAAPSQAEGLKTKQGIERLRNRDFAAFNPHFHVRRDEIEEALDISGHDSGCRFEDFTQNARFRQAQYFKSIRNRLLVSMIRHFVFCGTLHFPAMLS
jgi:hypothetical protein